MRIYHQDGIVVAWHDDAQVVPAGTYGAGVSAELWPDGTALPRAGDPPVEGEPDSRPYGVPPVTPAVLAYRRERTVIGFGQFCRGLAGAGLATVAQARALAKSRTPPTNLKTALDALPAEERDAAYLLLESVQEVQRLHPLVAAIAASQDPPLDDADLDAFFALCLAA